MPVTPNFRKRLNDLNNPFYKGVAETPMEFGIPVETPSAIQGINRIGRPRSAAGGAIPMIQDEMPVESGTEPDRPTPNALSRVIPGMEPIPDDPTFQPHSKHGFKDRMLAAFYGSQAAAAQQPNNQFASIGGLIGGLINPGGAERLNYEEVELPRARRKQQAVIQRNDSRRKQFESEIGTQLKMAELERMGKPEFTPLAGGEFPVLYDKRNPQNQVIPRGPDGRPLRNAGVVNAGTRAESAENLLRERNMAQAERDAAKAETAFKLKLQENEFRKVLEAEKAKMRKELEAFKQSQVNKRHATSEAGKNKRHVTPRPKPGSSNTERKPIQPPQ